MGSRLLPSAVLCDAVGQQHAHIELKGSSLTALGCQARLTSSTGATHSWLIPFSGSHVQLAGATLQCGACHTWPKAANGGVPLRRATPYEPTSTMRTGDDPTWLPALAAHQRYNMAECLSSSRAATVLGTIASPRHTRLCLPPFVPQAGQAPPPHISGMECWPERYLDDDIVHVSPRLRAIRLCSEHHPAQLGDW